MNVYTLLTSMTEGLKRNIYVKFELYDVPGMQTEPTALKELLDKDMLISILKPIKIMDILCSLFLFLCKGYYDYSIWLQH